MSLPLPRRGLYLITPSGLTGDALVARCEQALAGGAVVVQYRDKGDDADRRRADAARLRELTGRYGVPLVINDDVTLALEIGADGVHLGRDDPDPAMARSALGPSAIIGVSCYDQPARALAAESAGADYVAFGRFFPSASKPGATPAPLEMLETAGQRLTLPVVAIGGINVENGPRLLAAGADLLAVIGAVFDAPDPRRAAAELSHLFAAPA